MTLLEQNLAHYGLDHQINSKLIGEIGELLDALGKWKEGRAELRDVQEELCDILIAEKGHIVNALISANELVNDKLQRVWRGNERKAA